MNPDAVLQTLSDAETEALAEREPEKLMLALRDALADVLTLAERAAEADAHALLLAELEPLAAPESLGVGVGAAVEASDAVAAGEDDNEAVNVPEDDTDAEKLPDKDTAALTLVY